MIKVLRSWNEIGLAINQLKKRGLPLHSEPAKNWDFENLRVLLDAERVSSEDTILDLGCGPSSRGCLTLNFLRAIGYRNLIGVDNYIPITARVTSMAWGWRDFGTPFPYRLLRADIARTRLRGQLARAAVLLSVVEHGLDLRAVFAELKRLLMPGGVIYLSTDYWEDKIATAFATASGARGNQALPWNIFDRSEIGRLVDIAQSLGFVLIESPGDLACEAPTIHWGDRDYTFVALGFRKAL